MNALERTIRNYLRDNEGKAVENLLRLLEKLHQLEPNRDPKQNKKGPLDNLNLVHVAYNSFRNAIYDLRRPFGIQLPKDQHPYAEFVDQGALISVTHEPTGHAGWYCKKCGHRQGSEEPDWRAHCQNEGCKYPHQSMAMGARA